MDRVEALRREADALEETTVREALRATGGDIRRAARGLGLTREQFRSVVRRLDRRGAAIASEASARRVAAVTGHPTGATQ